MEHPPENGGWWQSADGAWHQSVNPPAPGWWLADDARWYPPLPPSGLAVDEPTIGRPPGAADAVWVGPTGDAGLDEPTLVRAVHGPSRRRAVVIAGVLTAVAFVGAVVVVAWPSPDTTDESREGPGSAPQSGRRDSSTSSVAAESSPTTESSPIPTQAGSELSLGLALDVGGRGDLGFNDMAVEGVEALSDAIDVDLVELAPSSPGDREANLELLADDDRNPIFTVGFAYGDTVDRVAPRYPDVLFNVLDTVVEAPNVRSHVFAVNEGAFLVGAVAGLTTVSDSVGFIGGVETELIGQYEAGFVAGVTATNPSATVDVKYLTPDGDFSGFSRPDLAREVADAMYGAGTDVVFHASGGSGQGLFDAAVAAGAGRWAIGVDYDQYLSATPEQQSHILTSMVKRVDVVVESTLSDIAAGKTEGGTVLWGVGAGGVGVARSGGYVDRFSDRIDQLEAQVASGEITVPTA